MLTAQNLDKTHHAVPILRSHGIKVSIYESFSHFQFIFFCYVIHFLLIEIFKKLRLLTTFPLSEFSNRLNLLFRVQWLMKNCLPVMREKIN